MHPNGEPDQLLQRTLIKNKNPKLNERNPCLSKFKWDDKDSQSSLSIDLLG